MLVKEFKWDFQRGLFPFIHRIDTDYSGFMKIATSDATLWHIKYKLSFIVYTNFAAIKIKFHINDIVLLINIKYNIFHFKVFSLQRKCTENYHKVMKLLFGLRLNASSSILQDFCFITFRSSILFSSQSFMQQT